MIVFLTRGAPREEVERLRAMLLTSGCDVREGDSGGRGLLFGERHWPVPPLDLINQLRASTWVDRVVHSGTQYPIVSRSEGEPAAAVEASSCLFGGPEIVLIAGPCTVESEETLLETAREVAAAGAALLRGGAFKPTTSPYSFRGHGDEALEILSRARQETGLGIVTEALEVRSLEKVAAVADIIQVGARNMQNFELLRELGRQSRPVLLKRGAGARIEEWLCAAEHIAAGGNERIILCERGIRTFETRSRATLDVSSIPIVKSLSRLPVIADPSHAAGDRVVVPDLALAAVAAGADGLLIEVHPRPEQSVKDGRQTISTQTFADLAARAGQIAAIVRSGRHAATKSS